MHLRVYTFRSMKKESDDKMLGTAFRALAETTRLKILLMLEAKPRTVGEIVDFFDLSQPTITRHLQSLLEAGLVTRTKKAQKVYYGLNADSIMNLCTELVACFPCCCVTIHPLKKSASKQTDKREAKSKPTVRVHNRPKRKEGE